MFKSNSNYKSNSASASNSSDIYNKITEQIIAKIEQGAGNFEMPWHKTKTGATLLTPINAVTGNSYKGVNIISLWASAMAASYSTGIWASYKQWNSIGAQVRKGEKASLIVFYKPLNIVGKSDSDDGEQQEPSSKSKNILYARASYVFNSNQVDGYNPLPELNFNADEKVQNAEKFFACLGINIEHGGNRACYWPGFDKIQMPNFSQFRDSTSYYSVLAHETTHWTGHASRCNRDLSGRFKSRSYAAEELIAELGAAFTCSLLGLTNEPRQDHASYISSWLELLKDDNRAIFTAASKAQEALDWLQAKQPQIELLSA